MFNKNRILSSCTLLIFCVLMIITFFSATPVFAEDLTKVKCHLCGAEHDLSSSAITSFQRVVYEMNDLVYAGQIVDTSDANDATSTKMTLLKALEFNTSKEPFASLWAQAKVYYNSLKGFGILLAVIYSLVETLAHISKTNLTGEYFAKELMKLTIAIIVILNGFEIVTGVVDIASTVFNTIGATAASSTLNAENCIYHLFGNSNPFEAIVGDFLAVCQLLSLLIPWVILAIVQATISILCWGRILELIVRVIFAPIGIADLFVHGTRSNGLRYLKQMLVCAIQGAVILGMIYSYAIIIGSISPGEGQWTITVVLGIVLLMSASGAKNIASDICGV